LKLIVIGKTVGNRLKKVVKRFEEDRNLDALIAEAIADCHDIEEATLGFFSVLEEKLGLPFTTQITGATVKVVSIEQNNAGEIVAVCERDGKHQRLSLLDLPLPSLLPTGAEWIAAYRCWMSYR
jgi:hypothetical protein